MTCRVQGQEQNEPVREAHEREKRLQAKAKVSIYVIVCILISACVF